MANVKMLLRPIIRNHIRTKEDLVSVGELSDQLEVVYARNMSDRDKVTALIAIFRNVVPTDVCCAAIAEQLEAILSSPGLNWRTLAPAL